MKALLSKAAVARQFAYLCPADPYSLPASSPRLSSSFPRPLADPGSTLVRPRFDLSSTRYGVTSNKPRTKVGNGPATTRKRGKERGAKGPLPAKPAGPEMEPTEQTNQILPETVPPCCKNSPRRSSGRVKRSHIWSQYPDGYVSGGSCRAVVPSGRNALDWSK